jgi:hypothetical protein
MTVEKDTWFIAHNGEDIFHVGMSEKGTALDSGQPYLETFDNEQEWKARCEELEITENNTTFDLNN